MKYQEFKEKVKNLPCFSSSMVSTLTDRHAMLRVQLSQWKKRGLLTCLRKGLYVLNRTDRVGEPSRFFLASQIFFPSYISLESALSFYGIIPEFVPVTTSVTARKTCRFENEFGTFIFQHIKAAGYDGFGPVEMAEGMPVFMAHPEKAVIDFLYLNAEKFNPEDLEVYEGSFRFQNCRNLSASKLKRYAAMFGNQKLDILAKNFIKAGGVKS